MTKTYASTENNVQGAAKAPGVNFKPVSVNLDADDYRSFQILCLRRGVKVSAALRDFIRRELSSERASAAAAQNETSHAY